MKMISMYANGGSGWVLASIGTNDALVRLPAGFSSYESTDSRIRVVKRALAEVGSTDWHKYYAGVVAEPNAGKMHWCGIFTLWVYHQEGVLSSVMWQIGGGYLSRIRQVAVPCVGDVAYDDQPNQHHALVHDVRDGWIYTIDGNSTGGAVRQKKRRLDEFSSFWSPYEV